ncbi:MAG: glutathione synthase, partial [Pseudomonadota bacterium]
MRQDPPFDMSYITATHLLELLGPATLVVNDPNWVRNAPEKLYVAHFRKFMPPTLISRSLKDLRAFREKHRDIIIKPLFGNGGVGVFRLKPDDQNFNVVLEMFFETSRDPVMAQAFVPAVRAGDKRIILVDGEVVGALNRIPPEGEARSNLHVGGKAAAIGLTERDLEICRAMGPELKARGLIFVGIDVIGDYLTEINVTSPTGIQEIDRFNGTNLAGSIWDAIERRKAS